jgi:hypothetical protein
VGPLPSHDGTLIHYSVEITPERDLIDQECLGPLQPLARTFSSDNAAPATARRDAGSAPTGQDEPSTPDAAELATIRDEIEACLVDAGVRIGTEVGIEDEALLRAAHDRPALFSSCVPDGP